MLRNSYHLRWLVHLVLRKLGFWGLLALGVTFLSAVLFYTEYVRIREALVDAEAAFLQHDDTSPVALSEELHENNQTDRQTLDGFYLNFPTADAIPNTLSALNRIADKHHINLNSGDYKLNKLKQPSASQTPNITQYEMVLPIEGSYPDIRMFMAAILTELPAIAISDIQLKREDTESPFVDAQLILTLFVRGEQA